MAERPNPITAICIFGFIISILLIVVLTYSMFSVLQAFDSDEWQDHPLRGQNKSLVSTVSALGIIVALIGLIGFYFLWNMKKVGLKLYGVFLAAGTIFYTGGIGIRLIIWLVVGGGIYYYLHKNKELLQ